LVWNNRSPNGSQERIGRSKDTELPRRARAFSTARNEADQLKGLSQAGAPLRRPRLQACNQQATQTTNQRGQAGRQFFKATFPGMARRKAPVFGQ